MEKDNHENYVSSKYISEVLMSLLTSWQLATMMRTPHAFWFLLFAADILDCFQSLMHKTVEVASVKSS